MDTPIIGMIGGVVALAIAISVGGTILATTTDQCVDVIYTEGVPDPDPVEWEPYWVVREDRIDDASYWREPFTELSAYVEGDVYGGDALGSSIWDNRHILAQVLDTCKCSTNSVVYHGPPNNNDCLGRAIDGTIYRDLNDQNMISHCQAPDADYSFFGPPFQGMTDGQGDGWGCDANVVIDCPNLGTFLDSCRLEPLGHSRTYHNAGNWCLTADGNNWDADTNPALFDYLNRTDYLRVQEPVSADQIAVKYTWVTTCGTAENTTLASYAIISLVVLVAAVVVVVGVLRRLV